MYRKPGRFIMISQKIENDITEEFNNLRKDIEKYLAPGIDISSTKQFLKTHIPEEVIYKSKILLDTLLNYLMKDALEEIKTANDKLQNAFYDADFRKRVYEWVKQVENKLSMEPEVHYKFDPRLKQGLIASGIAFVAGTGITYLAKEEIGSVAKKSMIIPLDTSVVGAIIGGIVSILVAAISFKIAFNKATHKARKSLKKDIDFYLSEAQKQVSEWLKNVKEYFEKDFLGFCRTNGLELEGN